MNCYSKSFGVQKVYIMEQMLKKLFWTKFINIIVIINVELRSNNFQILFKSPNVLEIIIDQILNSFSNEIVIFIYKNIIKIYKILID